ncbi:GNAT family protein [Plantactinospora sp. KLBMP9567]|uniref:GNAT family N-acetyltransferase n=1 Tax=Plantactinospora sp. KLBMP9567 TaxID=3085900 RepID=UPI002980D034|nr:GNAT family protein [Plantactinospora sp. KLBMP9567]MDW5330228.1 GNAT family protein [Plantactinospora sp. KLBMP9567]
MIRIRPAGVDDAVELAEAYLANRSFLAPWEPVRPESFFTSAGQRARLEQATADREIGGGYGCVIEYDGQICGTITLSSILRGPAQSANLGYWVAKSVNGRGVATRAVGLILDIAFGELDLHQVMAGTLLHNTGSQRVLGRNGFDRIGVARAHVEIAGEWQDHILFQRLTGR